MPECSVQQPFRPLQPLGLDVTSLLLPPSILFTSRFPLHGSTNDRTQVALYKTTRAPVALANSHLCFRSALQCFASSSPCLLRYYRTEENLLGSPAAPIAPLPVIGRPPLVWPARPYILAGDATRGGVALPPPGSGRFPAGGVTDARLLQRVEPVLEGARVMPEEDEVLIFEAAEMRSW